MNTSWVTCLGSFLLELTVILALVWCCILAVAYLTSGECKSQARLEGKTVLLTGCTSGIGLTTALELARRGARLIMACRNVEKANAVRKKIVEATRNDNIVVMQLDVSVLSSVRKFAAEVNKNEARLIMACRNVEKANAVRKKIVEATRNDNVVVMQLDVSVLSSVRKFAAEVNKNEPRLDVLIHNAGLLTGDDTTEDGINIVWATNYFGPFLLTHLLIDLMKKTGKSRIIYVSSAMHYLGRLSLENPSKLKQIYRVQFYCATKYAEVLVTRELSRRLRGSGVTANCLHPGAINTPICEQGPLWWKFLDYISKPMQKDLVQGAQTTIHLAVSEELEGVSGKYFSDCKVWLPAWGTGNVKFAQKHWKLSEDIVQLKSSDPHI